MRKFVFIDESIRDSYVMAAVIVPVEYLGQYRKEMSLLRVRGSLAFHMGNERKQKRDTAITALRQIVYLQLVFTKSKNKKPNLARRECLVDMLMGLDADTIWHLVIDRTTQEASDRVLIQNQRRKIGLDLGFTHASRYEDTGLWGANIAAWAGPHILN